MYCGIIVTWMREGGLPPKQTEINFMKKVAIKYDGINAPVFPRVRIPKEIIKKIEVEMALLGFPYGRMYPAVFAKKALEAIGVSCQFHICHITGRKSTPVLMTVGKGWYKIVWG